MSPCCPNALEEVVVLTTKAINIPNPLAKSFEGRYFVGYADELTLGRGTHAWAGLYNPVNSGIYLFVNVWTVTELPGVSPLRAEILFNASFPGRTQRSPFVAAANQALSPVPEPRIQLLKASGVAGMPRGGIKVFERQTAPGATEVFEEDGKYIFAPGGNLTVYLSNPETSYESTSARVAFGWWEEENYTL